VTGAENRANAKEPGIEASGAYLALKRWRLRAGFIFPLLCLLLGHPIWVMFWVGAAVILLGALLRIVSAGVIRKDEEVTETGPYAVCRNPLYLGTLLIQLGFALLSGSFILGIAGFLFFLWLYHLVITHEERWLVSRFGAGYLAYMRQVPRLVPKLTGWGRAIAGSGFTWRRLLEHRELPSTAAAIAGIAIFLLKYALGWNVPFSLW